MDELSTSPGFNGLPPPPPGATLDSLPPPPPGATLDQPGGGAEPKTLSEFGQNVLSSGQQFFGGVANAVAHPIDTLTGLAKLGLGMVASKNPHTSEEFPESTAVANAFAHHFGDRYGSWQDIKNTMYKDPVGFAADASAVLDAAGAGAKALRVAADAAGATRTADALGTAGELAQNTAGWVNPITAPVKAAGAGLSAATKIPVVGPKLASAGNAIARAPGALASTVLGKETGAGAEAFKTMWQSPEGRAMQAMRGDISGDDIYQDFKDALQNSRDARAQEYQQKLAQIQQQSGTVIDRTPIEQALNQSLQKFRVDPGLQPGQLDFSRSPIAQAGQSDIQQVNDLIRNWQDWSPEGADALKRRIDDTWSQSGQSRAFTTSVRNAVKSQLTAQIPEYAEMTKGYADATEAIKRIESDLSLGRSANPGTAARKLATALNQNQTYRQMLVESLQQYANPGVDLKGELAGAHLNEWAPRGIMGPGAALWALGHMASGHPGGLALLASTSPRLMGELTAGMSKAATALKTSPFTVPALRAGRFGVTAGAQTQPNPNEPLPLPSPGQPPQY